MALDNRIERSKMLDLSLAVQGELFEPIPEFLVGVRVANEPIRNYTIQAADHVQALGLVRDALGEEGVKIESILVRVK
jgi:hypothetical protein